MTRKIAQLNGTISALEDIHSILGIDPPHVSVYEYYSAIAISVFGQSHMIRVEVGNEGNSWFWYWKIDEVVIDSMPAFQRRLREIELEAVQKARD